VSARTLQFAFSAISVMISSAVFVIALNAAVQAGDGVNTDFSRGRGLVLALSVVLLAASVYILVRTVPQGRPVTPEPSSSGGGPAQTAVEADRLSKTAEADDRILQTLDADELRLYEMIREAGGEMLQMHVVSAKVFSKAKVTRLLDKLEKRGLVVRERHGMTNRIRVIR
jgi:uncharacterized membrane protein